ncbi:MAG TPA: hypothetical protein VK360_07200 [Acidimicrobiales bacterium]|nr:hypothetical protein [Acidimicrobiales bacterium]
MSEIGDLIAILVEIDRAVSERDDRRKEVADLVPAYRVGHRFGWSGAFVERPDVEGVLSLDEAITNLAEPTRFASMLPRRLLAVALAARMFRERLDNEDLLRALIIPGIVLGLPRVPTPPPREPPTPDRDNPILVDRAQRLLDALADPTQLRRLEDWHSFLRSHDDLVSPQLLRLPAPCATTVIEPATADALGAVALLQTVHCVGGVGLDELAAGFLDPSRWPDCSPWWCDMRLVGAVDPSLTRYLEVVAADCDRHLFEVSVFLDFATAVDRPDTKVVTYNMSRDQADVGGLHANRAVNVDRGVIEVRQEPDHVHVVTTKRVRFAQPVDSAALAVIACWVGYGDVAVDVICDCSGDRSVVVECEPASASTNAVNRFVDLVRTCLTEAGEEARHLADRLRTGTLSAETAAEEATRAVGLAVRGWGKVASTFVEAIGDLARPAAQPSLLAQAPSLSRTFSFDPTLAAGCSLELAGPLRSPYPHDQAIDTGRVEIRPAALSPGGTFSLAVHAAGLEGSAYTGEVVARNVASPSVAGRTARVYVIVP